MPDIVIAGTGQPELLPIIDDFNSSCIDKDDCYHLLGFIDDNEANQDREILGYKVLGPFDWIVEKKVSVINAIARTCHIRLQSTQRLQSLNATFINLVHPSVSLSYIAHIGTGNIISSGCVINPGVSIGSHNMLLTGVVLGHGVDVGSCSFFGHNVVCNGDVVVGDQAFLGSACQVLPEVNVSKYSKLAPGSVVMSNTLEGFQYVGNPARRLTIQ